MMSSDTTKTHRQQVIHAPPAPPPPHKTHIHMSPHPSLLVTHSWAGGGWGGGGVSSISGPTEGGINKEEEEGGGKSWKRYESRSERGGDCSGGEREGEREG